MKAHVLSNLLNELGKATKCEACRAFDRFFARVKQIQKYRGMNVRFYLIYDVKIVMYSCFWCENF